MFVRHVIGGVFIDRLVRGFPDQQQSERQRLGESGRKQFVEILRRIAAGLRMGIENVPELLTHLLQGRIRDTVRRQFGQSVLDDPPHEPRRMGQQQSQLLSVCRLRRVGGDQPFQQLQSGPGVVAVDLRVSRAVRPCRIQRRKGNQIGAPLALAALVEPQLMEVGGCPDRKFAEPRELAGIVLAFPLGPVSRLVQSLQLQKGPGQLSGPLQRQIRTAHPRVDVFGQHRQVRWRRR